MALGWSSKACMGRSRSNRINTELMPISRCGAILISESAYRRLRTNFQTTVIEDVDLRGIGRTKAYLLHSPDALTAA